MLASLAGHTTGSSCLHAIQCINASWCAGNIRSGTLSYCGCISTLAADVWPESDHLRSFADMIIITPSAVLIEAQAWCHNCFAGPAAAGAIMVVKGRLVLAEDSHISPWARPSDPCWTAGWLLQPLTTDCLHVPARTRSAHHHNPRQAHCPPSPTSTPIFQGFLTTSGCEQ